jgi:hypothetical protein
VSKTTVTRPQDKSVINSTTGRLILEWDTFFNTVQDTLNSLQTTGTFTLSNVSQQNISDTSATADSFISLCPVNAAAGTLMAGASALYISARNKGTGFTVATADGSKAAGGEQFVYWLVG